MDAPLYESAIRLLLALVATGCFGALLWGCYVIHGYVAAPLLWFLTFVVGLNALWRWYILWVGLMHDTDGHYRDVVEPFVRTVGSALLVLLYIALGLLAYFHTRRFISLHRP